MRSSFSPKAIFGIIVAIVILAATYWYFSRDDLEGIVVSNGRIEVTPLDISTKLPGRIETILADEGDYVEKGEVVAIMQLDSLEAQLNEAKAHHQQAIHQSNSAKAIIAARESDKAAAQAAVSAKQSQLYAAERKLKRIKTLTAKGATTEQDLDDQEAYTKVLQSEIDTADAKVQAAQSAIEAAKAQYVATESQIKAAQATIDRIEADIKDAKLTAPVFGRIQYRIAEPGEVLPAGGKVLNLLDLSKVNMTFFLPTKAIMPLVAGEKDGTEVRIVLDSVPEYVLPAHITFISAEAQFTPKTVQTDDEREKLMYRVKATFDPELLQKYQKYIKTGVTGKAYIKLNDDQPWPEALNIHLF
ncbi:hemolysin D [Wohlfahrtiimonas chitiniclastica]|uniref:HlyD family secretion protein n=1 Tax=Wohlfahrtiimonas chitiniclastica TaxID=400946 RepID=UPI000B97FE13|nr:HlyD family efflux transporter periplasmic adaptor subunit [Wohlfahrtiimonas chitiniclastica]OYQ87611.1 hemolysin D [Wohlfahrtiimonas chitiniclastica]